MAFVTAIGDIFPLVTAIADTNVSNGCDNGAVTVMRWVFNFHQVFSLSKIDWLQIESYFEKDVANFDI